MVKVRFEKLLVCWLVYSTPIPQYLGLLNPAPKVNCEGKVKSVSSTATSLSSIGIIPTGEMFTVPILLKFSELKLVPGEYVTEPVNSSLSVIIFLYRAPKLKLKPNKSELL